MKKSVGIDRGNCSAVHVLVTVVAATVLLFASPLYAAPGGKLSNAEHRILYQAQKAMAKKDYPLAEKLLSDQLTKRQDKGHYLVPFTLGNVLSMTGDFAGALVHYKTAVDRYPGDSAVWQNMGRAYYELNQFHNAAQAMERACDLMTPPAANLRYHTAVTHIMAEAYAAALPHLEVLTDNTIEKVDPTWLQALLKVNLALDLPQKALATAQRLLEKKKEAPQAWQILARLYFEAGDYKKAAAAMEIRAALSSPDRRETKLLGDVYLMAQIPLKAARQFEKLLDSEAGPDDFERTASAYRAAHRPAKAMEVLTRGLAGFNTPRLWQILGNLRYETQKYQHAYTAYKNAALIDPQGAENYMMMGYCALHLDQMEKAVTAFKKAAEFPAKQKVACDILSKLKPDL
jgi:tetratricopeptide (TPR) repeat protein